MFWRETGLCRNQAGIGRTLFQPAPEATCVYAPSVLNAAVSRSSEAGFEHQGESDTLSDLSLNSYELW